MNTKALFRLFMPCNSVYRVMWQGRSLARCSFLLGGILNQINGAHTLKLRRGARLLIQFRPR
jgi:hypothetical protein